MFFLKKFISRFFFPVPVCVMLLVAGLILLRRPGREKWGRRLVTAGTILLLLLGYPGLTDRWLSPLEEAYPPAAWTGGATPAGPEPGWICVLGRGVGGDASRPASSRMDGEYLQRVVEGVRLKRAHPGARLLVSVPNPSMPLADKRRFLDDLMSILGLSGTDADIVGDARDTAEEVAAFRARAGGGRVFLVSNAYHMPRSMRIARAAGLDAIPAPCGYYTSPSRDGGPVSPTGLFPTATGLAHAELAVYERLGLLWERARGGK